MLESNLILMYAYKKAERYIYDVDVSFCFFFPTEACPTIQAIANYDGLFLLPSLFFPSLLSPLCVSFPTWMKLKL